MISLTHICRTWKSRPNAVIWPKYKQISMYLLWCMIYDVYTWPHKHLPWSDCDSRILLSYLCENRKRIADSTVNVRGYPDRQIARSKYMFQERMQCDWGKPRPLHGVFIGLYVWRLSAIFPSSLFVVVLTALWVRSENTQVQIVLKSWSAHCMTLSILLPPATTKRIFSKPVTTVSFDEDSSHMHIASLELG